MVSGPGVLSVMKAITVSILAALALVACGTTINESPAAAVKTASTSTTVSSPGPTITVVGTGSAVGTPNEAEMSFGVESNAGSAAAAFSGEASDARKLIDALKGAGVAEADIQTQWLSLYQDTQHGGYTASSSVSAKLRDITRAGGAVDAAVGAAGNSIRFSGISLSIADTSSLMASARKEAVQDAAARAQQYASGGGVKLGGIVSISEQDNSGGPVRYAYAGAAGAAPAQPIEAGQQTLQVSVTVVYSLVQ